MNALHIYKLLNVYICRIYIKDSRFVSKNQDSYQRIKIRMKNPRYVYILHRSKISIKHKISIKGSRFLTIYKDPIFESQSKNHIKDPRFTKIIQDSHQRSENLISSKIHINIQDFYQFR